MARDSLKIAFVLSLVFNIAVVGAFAYGFARRPGFEVSGPRREIAPEDSFGRRCSHLAHRIGIPRERAARFYRAMAGHLEGNRDLRVSLQKARGELADLMGAPQIDEKAITAKVDEIASLQGQLEKRLIARLLEVSSTLKPEERERFMREIRFRCLSLDRIVPGGPGGAREEREAER